MATYRAIMTRMEAWPCFGRWPNRAQRLLLALHTDGVLARPWVRRLRRRRDWAVTKE